MNVIPSLYFIHSSILCTLLYASCKHSLSKENIMEAKGIYQFNPHNKPLHYIIMKKLRQEEVK